MPEFEHLSLSLVYKGRARLHGGGSPDPKTQENKNNRQEHRNYLKEKATTVKDYWDEKLNNRQQKDLPILPEGIPILLEVDTTRDIDYLRFTFEFEIVSEQEDGYVIVATKDIDLEVFFNKLDGFVNEEWGTGNVAKIHHIHDNEKRLERILSKELYQNWGNIKATQNYIIDVGIECLGTIRIHELDEKREDESQEEFRERKKRWEKRRNEAYVKWDELKMKREQELENFIIDYNGEILKYYEEQQLSFLPDSFTARIKIKGKGLKDLVYNFAYIFEVVEPEEISYPEYIPRDNDDFYENLNIIPPEDHFPNVCVIDSGIQERHKFIKEAINGNESECFIPDKSDVSDKVIDGGHGTRVAGAVLYPNEIPKSGDYQLPCWVQNARVLDDNNSLSSRIFPPSLLKKIVEKYYQKDDNKTKIFNHSISSSHPCRVKHMSSWAAEIDNLSHNNDILFVQSAGNILSSNPGPIRLGVIEHLNSGRDYPEYLLEDSSRIANPAQSLQAITVGSICYNDFDDGIKKSLGEKDKISAFSATGPGIWGAIKPDVVEYGGDYAIDTSNPPNITFPSDICPELIRTSPPGPAFDKDTVGTSFSTPKVTHIAALLEEALPDQPTLLYRALIAQSARWPEWAYNSNRNKYKNILRQIGYGLPNGERAIGNSKYRVTLITEGINKISAKETHIYEVRLPESLIALGEEYDILVEITLSYSAQPRRTRRNPRQYLSTWLDWKTSKLGETPESFINRVTYDGNREQVIDSDTIDWFIGLRSNYGQARGIRRSTGTLQKDWSELKSYQLTEGFCIAVRGHKGWSEDIEDEAKYCLAISFEAINEDIKIYDEIRSEIETEAEVEIRV